MSTQTHPQASGLSTSIPLTPGGAPTPHPTSTGSTTRLMTSGGDPISRQAAPASAPIASAPAGASVAGCHAACDAQFITAASDLPADRHSASDTRGIGAVGSEAGRGPATVGSAIPSPLSLLDPALALAADVLDDLERVRTANGNRLRILTTSEADSDGEMRGFGLDESHPDVAKLAAIVGMLEKVEHDAVLNLQRQMRRHPLHPWAKSIRGAGDKQVARLLAAVGDPYIRPELEREDGTIIPAGPRTVSALWAYCGLHVLSASGHFNVDSHDHTAAGRDQLLADQSTSSACSTRVGGNGGDPGRGHLGTQTTNAGVAPKRARGQKANWSTKAKTKAYLIATSCLKQLVKPCHAAAFEGRWLAVHYDECACSPYRVVYDRRRQHTGQTRPEWTDGHSHNDALRVSAKAFLRDLWREAKRIHEGDTQT